MIFEEIKSHFGTNSLNKPITVKLYMHTSHAGFVYVIYHFLYSGLYSFSYFYGKI